MWIGTRIGIIGWGPVRRQKFRFSKSRWLSGRRYRRRSGIRPGVRAIFKARQDLNLARALFAKRAGFCVWRARYLQGASGFAFGVHAICKARPDLHFACALFVKRARICISRVRHVRGAFPSHIIRPSEKIFVRQHVASVDRTGRFHPYRPIFFCPFSIFPGCREYGAEVTSD